MASPTKSINALLFPTVPPIEILVSFPEFKNTALPLTSIFCVGLSVPIPTWPVDVNLTLSVVLFVCSVN